VLSKTGRIERYRYLDKTQLLLSFFRIRLYHVQERLKPYFCLVLIKETKYSESKGYWIQKPGPEELKIQIW
jgi:hypothetical protein